MKRSTTISATVLFLITGFIGCNQSKPQSEGFITVDVTATYPKKDLILQDFMDVEYIPLETNKEFLTSGYVQAIGKNIIIVRNINQAGADIFIFDRKGKGLRKINRMGQGNGEYTFITGTITLDEDNDEIFVNCGGLRKVFVYDLFGNFKRSLNYMVGGKESGRFKNDIIYDPIYNFDQDNLICQDCTSGRNFLGREPMEPGMRTWNQETYFGLYPNEMEVYQKK